MELEGHNLNVQMLQILELSKEILSIEKQI